MLGHRRFRWYAAGSLVSLTGTWAQRIGLGWLVWELTGSSAWLGAVALAEAGPIAGLALIGGALGDRSRSLRLVALTLALGAASALGLGAVSVAPVPPAFALAAVLTLSLVNGAATALGQPARMALVPRLVPRADVPAAVAVGSVSFSVARLAGPLIGGALLAGSGPAAAFLFNALSYGVFLLALIPLRGAARGVTGSGGEARAEPMGRSIGRALAEAGRNPRLLEPLVLTGIAAVSVRPYVELLPAIASDLLASGPGGLALLASASGGGALLGGVVMVRRAEATALRRVAVAATAASAGAWLGLGLGGGLPVGLLCAGALGLLLVVSATAAQSVVQLESPEHMRSRLVALYLVLLRAGPALGALAVGLAADWIGLGRAIAGAALTGGVLAGVVWCVVRLARALPLRHAPVTTGRDRTGEEPRC